MQRTNPFKEGDRVEGRDSNIRGTVRKVLSADYVMIYEESADMDMDVHVLELVLAEWQGDGIGSPSRKEIGEETIKKPVSASFDLHYEKLPSSFRRGGLAPLEAQLSYFRYVLENSLRGGAHQLTFIHGKGGGELKQRLIQEIRKDKRIRSYTELRAPLQTRSHAIVVMC